MSKSESDDTAKGCLLGLVLGLVGWGIFGLLIYGAGSIAVDFFQWVTE